MLNTLWGAGAALLIAAAAGQALATESELKPAKDRQELRQQLEKALAEDHMPGASLVVFDKNGVVFSEQFGLADKAAKRPVTENTLFRIGSVSKTPTGIAILQLVEQGKLSLDAPVKALLPELKLDNPWEASHPVRLIHLLEHTAGLDDMHLRDTYKLEPGSFSHLDTANRGAGSLRVRWQPGTMMSYSNPGYGVLGAILERHYGQPWEQIIDERVLKPLGMGDGTADLAEAQRRALAQGYSGDDERPTGHPAIWLRAAGQVSASARDLAQLGRFMLSGGQSMPGVLKPETVAEMHVVHTPDTARAGLKLGYGLAQYSKVRNGVMWHGHNGGIEGFASSFAYAPSLGYGYVLLANTDRAGRSIHEPVWRYLVALAGAKPVPAATAPAPFAIDAWFRFANPRNELMRGQTTLLSVAKIRTEGDRLIFQALLEEPEVYHILPGGLLAEAKEPSLPVGVMTRDDQGRITVTLDGMVSREVSAPAALGPAALFILALAALVSAPFGRRKVLVNPWLRLWPSLALLALAATIFCVSQMTMMESGVMNWKTLGIAAGTWAFALAGAMGLWMNARQWTGEVALLAKSRCLLASLAVVGLSLWFWQAQWLGLALWLY
ncbi:MAG: beta-lactamase family protein [Gammaproteobacteria bacterium]|nr:beta-lactamase family protein [Gammaproteobacteria bacterium]